MKITVLTPLALIMLAYANPQPPTATIIHKEPFDIGPGGKGVITLRLDDKKAVEAQCEGINTSLIKFANYDEVPTGIQKWFPCGKDEIEKCSGSYEFKYISYSRPIQDENELSQRRAEFPFIHYQPQKEDFPLQMQIILFQLRSGLQIKFKPSNPNQPDIIKVASANMTYLSAFHEYRFLLSANGELLAVNSCRAIAPTHRRNQVIKQLNSLTNEAISGITKGMMEAVKTTEKELEKSTQTVTPTK